MFVPSHVQNLEFSIRFEFYLMFLGDLAWFLPVDSYQKLRHDRPHRFPRHYHLYIFLDFLEFPDLDSITVIYSASLNDRYLSWIRQLSEKNSLNERKFFVLYKMFGQLVMKRIHFFNQRIIWKWSTFKDPFLFIIPRYALVCLKSGFVNDQNFGKKRFSKKINKNH